MVFSALTPCFSAVFVRGTPVPEDCGVPADSVSTDVVAEIISELIVGVFRPCSCESRDGRLNRPRGRRDPKLRDSFASVVVDYLER